jgi:hypothetical protein
MRRNFMLAGADIISQVEGIPTAYPTPPGGLSPAAAALSSDMLWQRIESYIAWRWTSRSIVWIAEGQGEFHPNLIGGNGPAAITLVESWDPSNVWVTATPPLDASPLGGYWLPDYNQYRFTGSVGGGTVPQIVLQAFRFLAEFMAQDSDIAGAHSFRLNLPAGIETDYQRSPSWLALAMIDSGCADLLRTFRRTK